MKRTVLDTNIIISSALGGALVLILERWDKGEFTVIVTSDILREYFANTLKSLTAPNSS